MTLKSSHEFPLPRSSWVRLFSFKTFFLFLLSWCRNPWSSSMMFCRWAWIIEVSIPTDRLSGNCKITCGSFFNTDCFTKCPYLWYYSALPSVRNCSAYSWHPSAENAFEHVKCDAVKTFTNPLLPHFPPSFPFPPSSHTYSHPLPSLFTLPALSPLSLSLLH